jgi:hypothetical protein
MVFFKLFSASIARKQLGSENKLITGTITMPRSILLFERLWLAALAVGVIVAALGYCSSRDFGHTITGWAWSTVTSPAYPI